jgi:hypothetical protein
MRKIIHLFASLFLILLITNTAASQQSSAPLTSFDFTIVGIGLNASPDYQAVPKGINSQVLTNYFAPGITLPQSVIDQMPKDYQVKGELSGPAYSSPMNLTTQPGKPFNLPTLPILGKYTLGNIRLFDNTGKLLFGATPQAVTIESISDPLVTSVTTHQLTLQEIQQQGIVIDSSNYTAYQFTTAIATSSGQVPITLPVVIPSSQTVVT